MGEDGEAGAAQVLAGAKKMGVAGVGDRAGLNWQCLTLMRADDAKARYDHRRSKAVAGEKMLPFVGMKETRRTLSPCGDV